MIPQGNRTRRTLFFVALACVAYVSIEGVCYLGLIGLREKGLIYDPLPSFLSQEQKDDLKYLLKQRLIGHHSLLGWAPIPLNQNKYARINSQGLRSEWDYAYEVDPSHMRISAFGDSFTFGSEVEISETWERQLEEQDPRFEVLNFGVGAYGLDQAYLRYMQEADSFHSDIIVIGFMSENIYRNLNVYRPFYSSAYANHLYTKPRFSLEKGNLVLLKNPLTTQDDYARFVDNDDTMLREIGTNDYFYQIGYRAGSLDILPSVRVIKIATRAVKQKLNPVVTREGSYDVSSEAFRLTTTLLEEFYCAVLEHDSLPMIIIYPDLEDLSRQRSSQTRRYQPLLEHLQKKGFEYLDALDALAAYEPRLPVDSLTTGRWGHYSRLGNKIVANHLHKYLENKELVTRKIIKMLARSTQVAQHCSASDNKYGTAINHSR